MAPDDDLLLRPLQFLKGVGPRRAKQLEDLGLRTVEDLLFHLPASYYDRRRMTPLKELRRETQVTVEGVVSAIRAYTTSQKKIPVLEVSIEDGEGRATLVWFRQPFREKEFRIGDTVVASGKVQPGRPNITGEEFEILGEGDAPIHAAGLVPSYAASAGVSKRMIRSLVRQALDEAAALAPEVIPPELLARRGLPGIQVALRLIHDLHQRATLVVYDPEVKLSAPPPGLEVASTPDAALKGADGLVILTDWDEFTAFDPRDIGAALRRPVVVDAVGAIDGEGARAAGLIYVAIGESV